MRSGMMQLVVVAIGIAGCPAGATLDVTPPDLGVDPLPTQPSPPITPPTDTGAPQTTPEVDPCRMDPAMQVVSAEWIPGPRTNQLEAEIELSLPGPVALRCTADGDPLEQVLVEGTDDATSHTLRLEGLRPDTAFTCEVAPTCPTMADAPTILPLQTGRAPSVLPFATVEIDPKLGMTGVWTLMNKPVGDEAWIVVYDDVGLPRWWYELPAYLFDIEALYDPQDHSIVYGGGFSPSGRATVVHLWDGETYTSDLPGWQERFFHHDAKRIADGRLLTLEAEVNRLGNQSWEGFRVNLHDPTTGIVDVDVDSQRYVDEGLLRPGGGYGDEDPYHANWLDWRETPRGPELFVSLCYDHQIVAIDGTNGDMLWQLGEGRGWTVLDELGAPLAESALPKCQHGAEVDGDGEVFLLYDNGQGRNQSQAVEWQIDGTNQIAQRLWSWTEPGWNEPFLGDADYLDGDRILITEARFGFWIGQTEIVEVDRATGQVASRMSFEADGAGYRSERYGGCDLFSSVRHCDALADRWVALQGAFAGTK